MALPNKVIHLAVSPTEVWAGAGTTESNDAVDSDSTRRNAREFTTGLTAEQPEGLDGACVRMMRLQSVSACCRLREVPDRSSIDPSAACPPCRGWTTSALHFFPAAMKQGSMIQLLVRTAIAVILSNVVVELS